MALRKPNGSLRRPIAIGESIGRLTGKVTVDLISDHARTILWFRHHRSDPSTVALSVDISSAFNTVHRSAVLQAVRTHFPALSPRVAAVIATTALSSRVLIVLPLK